ncbi:MAG: flagellar hook-length control protein FliK [Psychrobium sp.]|nr:flagellar hook-length control protein FliK [Psychrobium sp.]
MFENIATNVGAGNYDTAASFAAAGIDDNIEPQSNKQSSENEFSKILENNINSYRKLESVTTASNRKEVVEQLQPITDDELAELGTAQDKMQLLKDDIGAQGLSNSQIAKKILALDDDQLTTLGKQIGLSSDELLELASFVTGVEQRINTDIVQRVASLREQLDGQGAVVIRSKLDEQRLVILREQLDGQGAVVISGKLDEQRLVNLREQLDGQGAAVISGKSDEHGTAVISEKLDQQDVESESFQEDLQYLKALGDRLPKDSDLQAPLRALVEEIEQIEAETKQTANELIEQIEQAKQDLVITFDEEKKSSSKNAQRESDQMTNNKVVHAGVEEKQIDVAASLSSQVNESEEKFEDESVNLVADSRPRLLDSEQQKAASKLVSQNDKAKENNEKIVLNENDEVGDKVSERENKREVQSIISDGNRAKAEASSTYQSRLDAEKQQSGSIDDATSSSELAVDEDYSDNLTKLENNSAPYGSDVEQKNKVQGSFEHLLKQLETTMNKTLAINSVNEESASVNQLNVHTEQLDKLREQPVATSKSIAEQLAQKLPLNEQAAAKHLKERVSLLINAGQGQAVIQLDPEELGGLSIRIQMQNDQVNVQFLVQNAGAKELLEQAMPKLKELLDQQGIALNQSDVQQEEQQQNSQENQSSFAGDNDEFETDQAPITLTLHKQSTNGIDYYA